MGKLQIFLFVLLFLPTGGFGQHCYAHVWKAELIATFPEFVKQEKQVEEFTQNWIQSHLDDLSKRDTEYTIPVVFHILWKETEDKLSEEQIRSQLEVLNQDFQAANSDKDLVPSDFRSLIANTGIRFCLAKIDPTGQPTNGITRTQTQYDNLGTAQDEKGRFRVYYGESGGIDAWDTQKYLNIWVAQRAYASALSSFPGTAIPEEDGIVIDPQFFGISETVSAPYHLGRTLTHEVGHYLNLSHPWGSASTADCEGDDQVEDTPRQNSTYLNQCPQSLPESCDSPDFFFNFMNFTDDACLAMFTPGQKMRMLAALEGPRAGLLTSAVCDEVNTETTQVIKSPFKVSLDPFSGKIFLQSPPHIQESLYLQLVNPLGQVFWEHKYKPYESFRLSVPEVPSGFYALRIHWQNHLFNHKLIFY